MCLSTLATASAAEVAAAAPDAERWFQLYVYRDRGVVLGADRPGPGVGVYRARGDRRPAGDGRARARASPSGAGARRYRAERARVSMRAPRRRSPREIDPDLSWSDIERFATESGLPVLVKGILIPRMRCSPPSTAPAASSCPTTVGASSTPQSPRPARSRPSSRRPADGSMCSSTAASAGAPTSPRRSRWAHAPVMVGRPLLWGLAVDGAGGAPRARDPAGGVRRALALLGVPRARDLDAGGAGGDEDPRHRYQRLRRLGPRPPPAARGHEVRGMSRAAPDARRFGAEMVRADAVSGEGLAAALDGVDVAYYLIHSMEPSADGPFAASASAPRPRTSSPPPAPPGAADRLPRRFRSGERRKPRLTSPAAWRWSASCLSRCRPRSCSGRRS